MIVNTSENPFMRGLHTCYRWVSKLS